MILSIRKIRTEVAHSARDDRVTYFNYLGGFMKKLFLLVVFSVFGLATDTLDNNFFTSVCDFEEIGVDMNETLIISRPEGDLCFTHETLVMIREKLLEALKRKYPPEDYAYLVGEIESGNAATMIFQEGANIGGWRLVCHDNGLFLEYQ